MGVNNRDRRRAKKQKRRRPPGNGESRGRRRGGSTSGPGAGAGGADGHTHTGAGPTGAYGQGPVPGDPIDEELVRRLVVLAAEAYRCEPATDYARRLGALLTAAGESLTGQAMVDQALAWWVECGLQRAWGAGWQPDDVVRVVRRTLSGAHADSVVSAVVTSAERRPENGTDDRWAGQVAALAARRGQGSRRRPWRARLGLTVEAVSLLLHLPALPPLGARGADAGTGPRPTGRRTGGGRSGAMLERVRALLAKAESSTFPAEAEALTAKAQELMARHAIDEAMLHAGGQGASPGVIGWRIGVDDPYARAKSLLLARIADANRCRAVWCDHLGFSSVFGIRADLEMVELLFTSLLVQGTEAMLRAGPSVDRFGRSRTRSFRQSFLLAYAIRIGERLAAATEQAVAEGAARHGAGLLPVLAGRAEAVEDAVRVAYPDLVKRGYAIGNYSGWLAGRAAAELARLGAGDELAAG